MSATNTHEQTTASILMKSCGTTGNTVGSALASVSVLYLVSYISSMGRAIVEYLPSVLASPNITFTTFIENRQIGNMRTYGILLTTLALGIMFRKIGTAFTDENNIACVERFCYKQYSASHTD